MTFYSFDTSALLNGRRDMLPPATFPTLWSHVEEMIAAGSIRSADEVERELGRREDEVHAWAKAQSSLFVPLNEAIQRETLAVLKRHERLVGKGAGRNAADPFVIALAKLHGGVVVTEERRKNLQNPRIPDACDDLGIRCIGLIEFVGEQGWSF